MKVRFNKYSWKDYLVEYIDTKVKNKIADYNLDLKISDYNNFAQWHEFDETRYNDSEEPENIKYTEIVFDELNKDNSNYLNLSSREAIVKNFTKHFTKFAKNELLDFTDHINNYLANNHLSEESKYLYFRKIREHLCSVVEIDKLLSNFFAMVDQKISENEIIDNTYIKSSIAEIFNSFRCEPSKIKLSSLIFLESYILFMEAETPKNNNLNVDNTHVIGSDKADAENN